MSIYRKREWAARMISTEPALTACTQDFPCRELAGRQFLNGSVFLQSTQVFIFHHYQPSPPPTPPPTPLYPPQWGTADAEIKVPSAEHRTMISGLSFNPAEDQNSGLHISPAARISYFLQQLQLPKKQKTNKQASNTPQRILTYYTLFPKILKN